MQWLADWVSEVVKCRHGIEQAWVWTQDRGAIERGWWVDLVVGIGKTCQRDGG